MRRRRIRIRKENNTLYYDNLKIIKLLKGNEPFIISRLGLGSETSLSYKYIKNNKLDCKCLYSLDNNAGIYFNNDREIIKYTEEYNNCLKNTNSLAYFVDVLHEEQKYFSDKYKIEKIKSRILEPFYILQENEIPWSQYLIDKKVLIINPFVKSFQKQIEKGWRMFEDKHIFLPNQQFIFYKSFNTAAGNHLHSSWVETFEIMKNDISKLDFDIALLGCGGYGLPLCNFIKMELGKSAIYIGGGIQLLFGVKGKRWENHPVIGKIIKDNGQFISPSGDEILNNNNRVEEGCYW